MRTSLRSRSRWLTVLGMLVVVGIAEPTRAAAEDINFSLDFVPEGFHAPFYVALEKKFYADEGLNVRISRGYGSGETVRKVAGGQFDLGLAHLVPLITAIGNENVQVKGVLQFMQRDMLAVWVRDEGKIESPKDLEGKTAATNAGNAQHVMFPAFAKAAGFDASKVKWITVEAALLGPMLINGQVDAIPLYLLHGPRLRPQAAERGIKLKAFPYADHGLETYAEAVIARIETIQKKPDMIRRFAKATVKAKVWAAEHPDEAARIVVKHNPEMNPEAARGAWEMTKANMFTAEALKDGLGRFEPRKLQTTIDIIHSGLNLKRMPTLEEVATNEFVP